MNKTVNINLGGMFFHIDEDAYQKLNRYFEAVKRSLSNSTGKEEIMKDIEMRVAELLTEKNRGDKQVVGLKDVEEVIVVMGQPEDYRIDDEGAPETTYSYSSCTRKSKKLYRDKDNGMVGGVLSGFGHYLGIDALWLRILMVILFFGFGTGLLIYIVLWILMPPAVTTTEKLEMTGEPVTISNIEKKVREEFDTLSEKIKNVDYDKFGNQVQNAGERIGNGLSNVILKIFSIIGKVIGAFLVVTAASTLVSLLLFAITAGSLTLGEFPWTGYVENFTEVPLWIIGILTLGAVGIPFFFLLILGLKLLVTNMKSIGNTAKYTLLALWIISVGFLIAMGIKQATQFSFDNKVVIKENIALNASDTLFVKFRYNDFHSKSIDDTREFVFTQDSIGKDIILSNNIEINLLSTDQKQPYLQIEKKAEGKSSLEAKKRAERINYNFKINGNKIILDNFFTTELVNKYRNQKVKIYLYIPEGTVFAPDETVDNFTSHSGSNFSLFSDYRDDENRNLVYKATKSELKCLNCPVRDYDENGEEIRLEYDSDKNTTTSDSTSTTTITINNDGMRIETPQTNTKKPKGLEENKNGVIIKSN
ncbi:PspC domain-containing protein [Flavobacterium macacae]|uniref:PspC domain-containing protein n=1 Tax=Flavobacterium macacae TaxID=2488993 RepID=A0A3P3WAA8_9FLAO|nr:PspC domain-containing protein [Flavobacterium macacae]RRJ92092.1 PspC domain-containing protein [Flavobacterium macacae]